MWIRVENEPVEPFLYVTVNRTVQYPSFEKWWTPLLCVDVPPSPKSHFQATWSFAVAPSFSGLNDQSQPGCVFQPDDGVGVVVGVVIFGLGVVTFGAGVVTFGVGVVTFGVGVVTFGVGVVTFGVGKVVTGSGVTLRSIGSRML